MLTISEESDLKIKNKITSIYFYSDWLLLHKKMMIMLNKIENLYSKIDFYMVDVDDFKSLSKRYAIESIPTVIFVNENGKELKRITGMPLTKAFKATVADIYDLHGDINDKKTSKS